MKHDMVLESKVSSSSPSLCNLLKLLVTPLVSNYESVLRHTSKTCAPSLSSGCTCLPLPPESHVRGGVIVYVDCTSFFHQFGLWDSWLVHET